MGQISLAMDDTNQTLSHPQKRVGGSWWGVNRGVNTLSEMKGEEIQNIPLQIHYRNVPLSPESFPPRL
jgi:hypothetical protein